jgi:hypothetical protein
MKRGIAEGTIRRLHYYFKIYEIIENICSAAETPERRLSRDRCMTASGVRGLLLLGRNQLHCQGNA